MDFDIEHGFSLVLTIIDFSLIEINSAGGLYRVHLEISYQ